jgi:hypothetical protein
MIHLKQLYHTMPLHQLRFHSNNLLMLDIATNTLLHWQFHHFGKQYLILLIFHKTLAIFPIVFLHIYLPLLSEYYIIYFLLLQIFLELQKFFPNQLYMYKQSYQNYLELIAFLFLHFQILSKQFLLTINYISILEFVILNCLNAIVFLVH